MANRSKIIGIDLGTTNSCIAVIEGGQPVVIPNAEGNRTTPSIVSFDQNGGRLIGLPAKRQAIKHPERTIMSVKRFMGTNERIKIDQMEFSAEQISACILQKLKLQAQQYLNEKVTEAIITVPAYFDDAQRLATRHAGEIAGLTVRRVVNEPTASALAYGFNRMNQDANVVVFDFGGGTFDVTILQLCEGVLQVKSTNGNNKLGGDDFDDRIINWIFDFVKKNYGADLRNDAVVKQRLKEAAEKAKIELSGLTTTRISLPFLGFANGDPFHVELELSQTEFARITDDLIKGTAVPIGNALQDAKLAAEKIDHVVLVGGTTRIPAVQQFIRTFFNKEPVKSVNPDEAVAIGAAIQGGILAGDISDILLLDVIPLTLGVEGPSGRFQKIVEKNTTIPATKTYTFETTRDQQTSLSVHVLQGESDKCTENVSLARFDVNGIPASAAGTQKVEVGFEIDADGIFNCKVKHAGGELHEVVLKRTTGYNRDQLEVLKREEQKHSEREQQEANRLAAAVMAESTLSEAQRTLPKLSSTQAESIKRAMESLHQALENASVSELEMLRQKLETQLTAVTRTSTQ